MAYKRNITRLNGVIWHLLFLLILASCSSTKFVPDEEYLLDEVNILSDNKVVKPADLKIYLRQQPNTKWFNLLKTQLYIYDLAGADSTKWLNRALQRMGTPPVLYSAYETERSRQELQKAVRNMGYMRAVVQTNVQFKDKKARLNYKLNTGNPYTVRSIAYDISDTVISSIMRFDSASTLLHAGMLMNINELDNERSRITALLHQNGFYKFNKEYLTFTADTARNTHVVDLTMHLSPAGLSGDPVKDAHKQYYINKIRFISDGTSITEEGVRTIPDIQGKDSVSFHELPVYFKDRLLIRPRVLAQNLRIESGKLYNGESVEQTYQNFNRLSALRYTNIKFEETQRNDSSLLNAYILMTQNKSRSVSFEVEGTNSAGDLGAAAALSFNNRNIFRGSELLSLKLRGAYEAVSGLHGNYRNESYTELSAEADLNFPRFVFPFLSSNTKRHIRANTQLSLLYSYQLRPEFTRIIASTGWSYQWNMRRQHARNRLDLLDISYLYMPWIHPEFKSQYLDQQDNYILRYNYEDRLIVRTGYSYVYNSSGTSTLTNSVFNGSSYTIRFNVEAAGNALYALSKITKMHSNQQGEYAILNIPYAQYVKMDFDYARNISIDNRNSVAYHFVAGFAYPYGNASMIPFEKRYFSGGANSIRGWSVRGLGPGAFPGDGNFMNQTGDLKLEGSIEYRSRLFWKLMGAAFIDAGNIWTVRNYKNQPGGQFKFNQFYKQIAAAYGLGLRLDLELFILRFDGGMKAINPVYESGIERYPVIHPKFGRDFAFHFAVGYPF